MQVLVKTAPGMLGSYSFEVAPEDVKAFTARHDIWWWTVPVDDVLDGSGWHKGGAWAATDGDRRDTDLAADLENTYMQQAAEFASGEDDGDEEADSRW